MTPLDLTLIRGHSANAASFLKPHLILHPWQDREFYATKLAEAIQQMGENIFILTSFTNEEHGEPKFVGFVIAYLNFDQQCYFPQCWVDEKVAPKGTSELLYSKVLNWAESKGCKVILGEFIGSKRIKAVERRWGFKVASYTIKVDLTDEYVEKINKRLTTEIENGKSIREQHPDSVERVSVEQKSTDDLKSIG